LFAEEAAVPEDMSNGISVDNGGCGGARVERREKRSERDIVAGAVSVVPGERPELVAVVRKEGMLAE
jgi:hypothetical protein